MNPSGYDPAMGVRYLAESDGKVHPGSKGRLPEAGDRTVSEASQALEGEQVHLF